MLHSVYVARTIVGIIGNIISFGLFLSPVPTVWRWRVKKSVEEFHPYIYLAGVMNCCLWVYYGIVHPHSTLVWSINAIGLAFYFIYLSFFVRYAPSKGRYIVGGGVTIIGVAMAAIVVTTQLLVHTVEKRSRIVGILAVIFNIGLYGSPLSTVFNVFKTKSVEFLPFWICFAGFANGCIWTAYGLMPFDINLLIGNGLGACLGLFQLILHLTYGKNKGEKTKQVELQEV